MCNLNHVFFTRFLIEYSINYFSSIVNTFYLINYNFKIINILIYY